MVTLVGAVVVLPEEINIFHFGQMPGGYLDRSWRGLVCSDKFSAPGDFRECTEEASVLCVEEVYLHYIMDYSGEVRAWTRAMKGTGKALSLDHVKYLFALFSLLWG